jgi:hypothetical protein
VPRVGKKYTEWREIYYTPHPICVLLERRKQGTRMIMRKIAGRQLCVALRKTLLSKKTVAFCRR